MKKNFLQAMCGLGLCALGVLGGCNNDDAIVVAHVFGTADAGLVDGDVTKARFSNPVNVEVAADGTVYVADFDNDVVRAISPAGMVSTVVQQASFSRPFGLSLSHDGTKLYIQTDANDLGARDSTTGTIWALTRAGNTVAVVARNLGRPRGILALPDGRIAMADLVQDVITVLDPATGTVSPLAGSAGMAGFVNGSGSAARFNRPYGMGLLPDGSLLVADQNNNSIRQVTLAGVVTTYAGTGTAGNANGAAAAATFNGPEDVAVSASGDVYVADTGGHLVRRVNGGSVSTEAGNGTAGFVDDADNTKSEFFGLEGIALSGDGSQLWIADGNGGNGDPFNRVRSIKVP